MVWVCTYIKKMKKKIQFQKSWIKWLDSPLLMFSPLIIESESESHSVVSDSFRPHGLYRPWNSPGQNTGVGSLCLLQGIFPTQGLNSGLSHCRQILNQLSHNGSPRILEWVPIPSPADLPNPGIKLGSPALQVDSLPTELLGKPWRSSFPTFSFKVIAQLICIHGLSWSWEGLALESTAWLSVQSSFQAGKLCK